MAQVSTGDSASLDILLQRLQKRPNVVATLILSRRDGSIIKAFGPGLEDEDGDPELMRPLNGSDQENITERLESDLSAQTDDPNTDDAVKTKERPTRTQVLASSIFAFVASAGTLRDALQRLEEEGNLRERSSKTEEEKDRGKIQHEDEIQLLRLRLRKQEVIIFPDFDYLCCVLHDLDKAGK